MRRAVLCLFLLAFALGPTASASVFLFNTDPFAGTPVLSAPGRQIVGGELFINFLIAHDTFEFDPSVFGIGNTIQFVNSTADNLPSSGVNAIVLETFDDDNNSLTPFGAGNAADLIADKVTTHGAGFFVYFNQSLDMPRLVYSTDLADKNADLKIMARMLNLFGDTGRQDLPDFNAGNFDLAPVPEPSSLMLLGTGMLGLSGVVKRKLRK